MVIKASREVYIGIDRMNLIIFSRQLGKYLRKKFAVKLQISLILFQFVNLI